MQITIQGHKIVLTPALKEYIHKHLARLRTKMCLHEKATHAVVTVAGNGPKPSIMVAIHLASKKVLTIKKFLDKTATDFYDTVKQGFAALSTQLERHAGLSNEKHKAKRRKVLHHKQALA